MILAEIGNLSIVAPLANVVLLPVVPSAMLFGVLVLAGGLLWLPLGQALAMVAYLFLAWLTEGARLFANLPYAAVQLPPFPLWVLLGYYAIVVGDGCGTTREMQRQQSLHSITMGLVSPLPSQRETSAAERAGCRE